MGFVTGPALFMYFNSFDLPTVVMLAPLGFGVGLIFGNLSWFIFHGTEYNKQNEKTYYMPMTETENMRGGIIYTDEEAKNARDNKRKIR